MLASKCFGIKPKKGDDWFDAILNVDTPLFVDPFLVFKEDSELWADAHESIIKHFENAFLLIAEGNLKPTSLAYKKALAILEFKEPKEMCLGYTESGVDGAGSGRGFAKKIADAITEAIKRGLIHPKHFEELGVLSEGIGPDRISDITCTILKTKLIRYTQKIALRHNIKLDKHKVFAGNFNEQRKRWESPEVNLPTNPFSDKPFLFVPERFLSELPELNASDWWEYYESVKLRDDVNYEIMGKVDKKTIIEMARKNPQIVRDWTIEKEASEGNPYRFDEDPLGYIKWFAEAERYAKDNPLILQPATTPSTFFNTINSLLKQFKFFIEEQGGWSLLWNEKTETDKREKAVQLLFKGIASNYCKANNISIDAEVNLGRGPVDFKFSNGYSQRAHLEIKKVHNGAFWDGLKSQLPSYMNSDEVKDGWFLAVRYRDTNNTKERLKQIPEVLKEISAEKGLNLRYIIVDARPKDSASKIRDEE
jgi:hypothetical protein